MSHTLPTIVTRTGWGARKPRNKPTRIATPSPRLWAHHAVAEWHGPQGMRQLQDFHMDSRGYNDIGYSFLVDDNGDIFEGRGARVLGAHTGGDNSWSHAICGMGNFDVRQPTRAMVNSFANLVAFGYREGWWPDRLTGGHRSAPGASTACPGRYLQAALADINFLALGRATLTPTTDTPTEDPMPLPTDVVDVMPAPGGGFWQLTADGGVEAEHGAPFWGSYPALGLPARTDFVALTLRPDGRPGYTLWTKNRSDAGFHFPVA